MLKSRKFFKYSALLFLLVSVVATYHKIFVHGGHADNNLKTFLGSYVNLLSHVDLYIEHPGQHGDLFKYTPTFPLFMWPFAALPYLLAAPLFNLCNTFVFILGVRGLNTEQRNKNLILWASFPEMMGAIQNFQTNAFIAGLFLIAYTAFRRQKVVLASLSLVLAFFTKIFAGALVPIGWMGSRRWKYVAVFSLIFVFFLVLPAFFVGFDSLIDQYRGYIRLQGHEDGEQPVGYYSLMHVIAAMTGLPIKNIYFQIAGAVLVAAPMLSPWGARLWRKLPEAVFASAVLFMLVFNHRSESETFIIGMVGFLVWFVAQPRTGWMWLLFGLNFVCASVLYGDLLTAQQKIDWLEPFYVKIWGVLLCWFIVEYQILRELLYSMRTAAKT